MALDTTRRQRDQRVGRDPQLRVVDAFMFSEPHEADVLWVKLNVEEPVVDRWVVVENSYTFQGEFKGHHLTALLDGDSRFGPFRERIEVLECEIRPDFHPPDDPVFDTDALTLEATQREVAVEYIIANYEDTDYVVVSDVDECLDAQSAARRRLLARKLAAGRDVVLLPRIRYWFDYDNRGLGRRSVPVVMVRRLKEDPRLSRYREEWRPVVWRHEMVFEYSYCFSHRDIMRKFDTFSHTGFEPHEVDAALRYNHRPTSQHRPRRLGWGAEDWFVTRRLNRSNSPAFVRAHIDELRTNVVHPEYRENRLADYPQYFPPSRTRRAARWGWLYLRHYGNLLADNARDRSAPIARAKAVARRARRVAAARRT